MKIQCITNKRINGSNIYQSLTLGKEYVVLSVEFYNSSSAFSNSLGDFIVYRIKDDDELIMPYPSKIFKIVSPKLPACWIGYRNKDDLFSLSPKEWARNYFWDDFYNDENNALSDYERMEKIIYSESE